MFWALGRLRVVARRPEARWGEVDLVVEEGDGDVLLHVDGSVEGDESAGGVLGVPTAVAGRMVRR